MQFIMVMKTKAYHTFLGFSWHILFADVAVINITLQIMFTYDIFLGLIHKALIGMGVNFSMAIRLKKYCHFPYFFLTLLYIFLNFQ